MPAERLSMRQIKEVLRLRYGGQLSYQQIATSLRLSVGAVFSYVKLAQEAGLSWPLPPELDDAGLEKLLFPRSGSGSRPHYRLPDWSQVHQELKRKGVTLQLLWEEYQGIEPTTGYGYAQFCQLYRRWRGQLKRSLRQTHRAGEKLFIDYCGPTVPIQDPTTGEVRPAQIFVAVLGASNYCYAEATWSQALPDWLASHVRAFEFFGGVVELLVIDNLRAGVSRACRYEPELNPSYAELAGHYGVAVLPARPSKPKDKAKVEVGVQVVERWILARLRHQTFFSLGELNTAIRRLLVELNERPFKRLPGSRASQFAALDQPALRPLPVQAYEYAEWHKVRVGLDYHLEVAGHFYSVPHQLLRQLVEVRLTATTIECFARGRRVASHVRSLERGGQTTLIEHLPKAHQQHLSWTPARLLEWAQSQGPETHALVEYLLEHKPHPEQGYRSCLGLQRLARHYGSARLEAACQRARQIGSLSYRSVGTILQQGLDRQPLPLNDEVAPLPPHANVRGAAYYQ